MSFASIPAQVPRLLFVEDDRTIAGMVIEVLQESYQVDHALTGEDGLQQALRTHYDVIVMDRRLPGIDGVEVIHGIRRAGITTPILMLTALGSIDDRVSGLDEGANDYLTKPFDFDELLARLRSLRRGFAAETGKTYIQDWLFVAETLSLYDPYGTRVSLTGSEAALLGLLVQSPEHIFSRTEILEAIFSPTDTPGTVDTYVHYIRRKTERGIIQTVRSQGYRLGDGS